MNSRKEVLENLKFADQYMSTVFPDMDKLSFVITGGASFLLKGFSNKFTLDIDTITEMNHDVLQFLESFSINNSASEVTKLPKSYKERLVKLKGKFEVLDLYLLSHEDLVLSKIGRLSEDDLRDIEDTGIMEEVDMSLLTKLAEELSAEDMEFGHKWRYFNRYFSLKEVV
ncbi:hypothetical protein CVD28_02055 [Bacillus sp. M6-12]|uniref:DUF6036 family nucleotidyltransferase n=1 Tax=Bacillus sp. M6-12 TaxID=2054166 RepID=UPI000C79149D|nr:DUF6036 family nucleotidyltransferase [Bacillus sp. M6-12]PLS19216.1 hypothetical protein CVD28_02055 [Bacillus sp. M6-12]